MTPGRKFSIGDVVRILIQRSWLIVLAAGLGAAVAVAVSKKLPDQYRSETTIMLVPQRVPDSYVRATVTTKIEDRLATLQDQILSRSRLEQIIQSLNLYPALRTRLPMEDVVQRMRDDITIRVEGKESFRVSYVSQNARTAQKATEKLASLFIEESMRDRENLAEDTNQFLDAQLEDAKRRLIEHEKKLEEYRTRYGGELPTQAASNLQGMQNAEGQLQRLGESVDRSRQHRLLLEGQIVDLQSEAATTAPAALLPSNPSQPEALVAVPTAVQLQNARATLQAMQQRYKPDYPDIKILQRNIRDLEAKLAAESHAPQDPSPAAPPPPEVLTPAARLKQQRLRDLRAQVAEIDRQLAEAQDQDKRLHAAIADYQSKLDAVPKRESELIELTRDYTTLQSSYQSLLSKREESKLAANLERRNIGEQFKVLDPARVPERPFSPNRMMLNVGGVAAGLAFAALLIVALEFRQSGFRSEEDVERLCELPVLAIVPSLTSRAERRSRLRKAFLFRATAIAVLAAEAAVVVWGLRR